MNGLITVRYDASKLAHGWTCPACPNTAVSMHLGTEDVNQVAYCFPVPLCYRHLELRVEESYSRQTSDLFPGYRIARIISDNARRLELLPVREGADVISLALTRCTQIAWQQMRKDAGAGKVAMAAALAAQSKVLVTPQNPAGPPSGSSPLVKAHWGDIAALEALAHPSKQRTRP